MNERARDRVVILLGVLRTYPEATALSIYAVSTWVIVSVTVSSDEAVAQLDEDLELGGIEIKIAGEQWRRRARLESRQDRVRIEVTGPKHLDPPPGGDAEDASS